MPCSHRLAPKLSGIKWDEQECFWAFEAYWAKKNMRSTDRLRLRKACCLTLPCLVPTVTHTHYSKSINSNKTDIVSFSSNFIMVLRCTRVLRNRVFFNTVKNTDALFSIKLIVGRHDGAVISPVTTQQEGSGFNECEWLCVSVSPL